MAGSFNHALTEDRKHYRGTDGLENMGDMKEAVDEMVFMLLLIQGRWGGDRIIKDANDSYYRCLRGEESWPDFMKPGIDE
jgi:hypothetical protein